MDRFPCFSQDAHSIIPRMDEETSLFAVYDGHGGKTIAHQGLVGEREGGRGGHCCSIIPSMDEETSLFAVYDGHGGDQ